MLEVRNTYTPQGLLVAINCKRKKIAELTKAIHDTARRKQTDHPSYARFSEKEFLDYKIKNIRDFKRMRQEAEKELQDLEHYFDKGWYRRVSHC